MDIYTDGYTHGWIYTQTDICTGLHVGDSLVKAEEYGSELLKSN